ncbi:glycosyltransferase [Agromyces mediolanus]|uniref:glycosyltransferase family 2 protein n=1 Tax=Agromyces mediolanus TaxID=41986 RepID=UPI0020421E11|nr:glycosyltransferase family 2 protein [Agromyces mediolanus]MCM3656752.1 glycosyltransferase [Agromyces mediolanus]
MGSISVVIPCLDDAAMLRACLAALAGQTRPPDEVIVVDNGSRDDSAAVALAAGARVVTQPRRGIWPATAAGFDAARGELLARLDADSVPPSDWLARVEERMARTDAPTAVTGPGRFYGGTAFTRWVARYLYIGGYFWAIGILLGHPPLFGSNYALRADAWRELRGIVHRDRADVHDDLDLAWWLRPGMSVAYEPTLVVEVSARPFDSWAALGRRLRMAFHTLAVEWREWPALARRAEHREAARDAAADAGDQAVA